MLDKHNNATEGQVSVEYRDKAKRCWIVCCQDGFGSDPIALDSVWERVY